MNLPTAIIGYSGHAHVICDACELLQMPVSAYCDIEEKKFNPFHLQYLGHEENREVLKRLRDYKCHVSIGSNQMRDKVLTYLNEQELFTFSVIHPDSSVSNYVSLASGVFIGAAAVVNAFAKLGQGVVANTGCVIEHGCVVNRAAHIAPGAVIAGGVHIGERVLIGANATVREEVKVGDDAIIGAGSVVVRDVAAGDVVVGNPARSIKQNKK